MADNNIRKSYTRSHYKSGNTNYVSGSTAPAEYETDDDSLDYFYVNETPARELPARQIYEAPQENISEKTSAKMSAVKVLVAIALIVAFVWKAFNLLETKSDINQLDKQIKNAKICLEDVNSVNESLMCSLDINHDRNYIYNVAVGKLGMVYPKDNKVVYYSNADSSHVIQYSVIQ